MLSINLTLFIQVVHFYCAYRLVWWLLLRPVLEVVTNERKMVQGITSKIERERAIAAKKEASLDDFWASCKEQLRQKQPPAGTAELMEAASLPSSPVVEMPQVKQETVEAIRDELVKRIAHD